MLSGFIVQIRSTYRDYADARRVQKEVVTDRDPDLDVTNLSYKRRLPYVPYQAGKRYRPLP
jgi:hypothetical protein